MTGTTITVTRTGPRTLLLRDDRVGRSAWGVPPGGPFDRGAFETARALVGGLPHLAAFECVLGGLALRTDADVRVAVTGARVPVTVTGPVVPVTVDGSPVVSCVLDLPAGSGLTLGMPRTGLRTYVWVGGGLSGGRPGIIQGFGPSLVAVADTYAVAEPDEPWLPEPVPALTSLDVLPGPRSDQLTDPAQLATEWTVSPHSDRVGVRLDGPALARTTTAEIAPEGLVRGAIQAPPGGQLVVFGPDHPTTGGYPVVGVLTPESVDALAQKRPGERVTLRWVSLGN